MDMEWPLYRTKTKHITCLVQLCCPLFLLVFFAISFVLEVLFDVTPKQWQHLKRASRSPTHMMRIPLHLHTLALLSLKLLLQNMNETYLFISSHVFLYTYLIIWVNFSHHIFCHPSNLKYLKYFFFLNKS